MTQDLREVEAEGREVRAAIIQLNKGTREWRSRKEQLEFEVSQARDSISRLELTLEGSTDDPFAVSEDEREEIKGEIAGLREQHSRTMANLESVLREEGHLVARGSGLDVRYQYLVTAARNLREILAGRTPGDSRSW